MKELEQPLAGQRGSISVLMLACIAVVLVLCALLADVGLYLAAGHQAQNAADAAALAAVQESFTLFSTGEGAREAARTLASANGSSLVGFNESAGGDRVQVEVSARPPSVLLQRLGIGPDRVLKRAAAEVDLEALLASRQIWFTADPRTLSLVRSALLDSSAKDRGGVSTMVALLALQHLGKPYVRGATGPDCFDCSGLVCYVFAQIGIRLPRVTFSQVIVGHAVSVAALAPGDLVFFHGNGHVGIYLGGGWFVHAPHTGDVVKISALGTRSDVSACRRVI